mmetsp:Transcript_23945/g.35406  ORF Transcript_23945/g.35406 Transcript_23945/m.35406 type:complete len:335 (-) Transcript_23945:3010-4014(-)
MSFRVAIIGAQAPRISRVLSILQEEIQEFDIEFLALVASFGVYIDQSGKKVKFLSKISYHGPDGKRKGASVSEVVNELAEEELEGCPCPISVFAIGCGIEEVEDIEQIKVFFENIGLNLHTATFKCVAPNSEYKTMKEETEAYRQLDAESKRAATLQQTIGPGKMAKFVCTLVEEAKPTISGEPIDVPKEADEDVTSEHDENTNNKIQVDPSKILYACRICRKILFSEEHLEYPPHVQAQHNFGWKKPESCKSNCQSLFLGSGMPWMCDLSAAEGKFCCPGCSAKVGSWNWSGAQCSCGTWITPAIQVPISKVDLVRPAVLIDKNFSLESNTSS